MKMIELSHIKKSYGKKVLFDDFSLSINQGDFLCITGKSGSGKSTLLNMMGLLEEADGGTICIKESGPICPRSKESKRLLRESIGFLFQNYGLIDDRSIKYNLDVVGRNLKGSKQEKIKLQKQALRQVGLDLDLSMKVYQLSGGEQQRVALARLLMKNCEIILADEPTASLDLMNREIVLECLRQLNAQGKTIVLVSHDPYIIENIETVIELA